jgi:hypothetical protein
MSSRKVPPDPKPPKNLLDFVATAIRGGNREQEVLDAVRRAWQDAYENKGEPPRMSTIDTSLARDTLRRAVAKLEKDGLVKRVRDGSGKVFVVPTEYLDE